jgi:putative glutathione S-transferase
MGYLDKGEWVDAPRDTRRTGGRFVRTESQFRNWVTADGSPGPETDSGLGGAGGFKAEPGRYHLYVSWACPWAHRTLIVRALKGLEDHVSLSAVHWRMHENGWTFADDPDVIPDPINHADYMWQVYRAAQPDYSGRASVPVLWDRTTGTIVSNESSEIIRMFNSAFDGLPGVRAELDLYPADRRAEIDAINGRVYETVNNGVYKSGFATSQAAYEEAATAVFESLDWLEGILGRRRYLAGDRVTEADWRLFTTLVRFDPVYFGHFKCNLRRIFDCPNLWNYTKELYQWPGVAATVNLRHIKSHYYGSHETVNPTLIIPIGPAIDYSTPHDRDRLSKAA